MAATTPYGVGAFSGMYTGSDKPTIAYVNIAGASITDGLQAVDVSFKSDATILDLNDSNGQPSGFLKVRGIRTLSFKTVVRITTTPTVTEAIAAVKGLRDLQVVTLANFIKSADAWLNGDYVYRTGCGVGLNDEREAEVTFELMQYFGGDGVIIPAGTMLAAVGA